MKLANLAVVEVYPFHAKYPGLAQLYHVSCSKCSDYGVCTYLEPAQDEAQRHRNEHAEQERGNAVPKEES